MASMKERGLIRNADQVRAILAGATQIRVPVKIDTCNRFRHFYPDHRSVKVRGGRFVGMDDCGLVWRPFAGSGTVKSTQKEWNAWCPLGQPGDRLWVRETFQPLLDEKLGANPEWDEYDYETGRGYCVSYPATDGIQEFYDMATDSGFCSRMTPSTQMPRWASRITLEITKVSVERLQDITWKGISAEGVELIGNYRGRYRLLWDKAYGSGAWERNEWVWVVDTERVGA